MSDRPFTGTYQILTGEHPRGTESIQWESGDSGIRTITSRIERCGDLDRVEILELKLAADDSPSSLSIAAETSSGKSRYTGRKVGNAWVSQFFREEGSLRTVTLAFHEQTHVDYFTPVTNSLTIQRLNLLPSDAVDITVVFIDVDTFMPRLVNQRYERLAVIPSAESTLEPAAAAYRYTNLSSGAEGLIWVDTEGHVVRYRHLFERIA